MEKTLQRVLIAGLVVVPAGFLLFAQVPMNLDTSPSGWVSLTALGALAVAGGRRATQRSSAWHGQAPSSGRAPLRNAPANLPAEAQQRAVLRCLLTLPDETGHVFGQNTGYGTGWDTGRDSGRDSGPMTRAEALTWILRRCLLACGAEDLNRLDAERRLTLYVLSQVLSSTPGDAARLADFFARPDAVLGLRDEVERIALDRAIYEQDLRLFRATEKLWVESFATMADGGCTPPDVRALGASDIDLWHHIVATHDPNQQAPREIALWCVERPGCDRATVALYLARIAGEGHLQAAWDRGDLAFLEAVRDLIDSWNAGSYRTCILGLTPPEALKDAAERVSAALQVIAHLDEDLDWVLPRGAFTPHPGRPPRPRAAWDLGHGLLRHSPARSDYMEPSAHK